MVEFSELPAELRLQIWHHLAHHPRLITMTAPHTQSVRMFSHITNPPLLHINRESCQVGLGIYIDLYDAVLPYHIYVNPRVDDLYFNGEPLLRVSRDQWVLFASNFVKRN